MLYWLELDEPLGNARKSSRLYMGFASDDVRLYRRLIAHAHGRGSSFTRAAVDRGIGFKCIGIAEGTRADERRLKNRKNHRREFETLQRRGLIRLPTWLQDRT